MKKLIYFTIFNLCFYTKLLSQNVTIIPNLDTTDIGVMGNLISSNGRNNLVSYNGNLYFPYQFSGVYPNPKTNKNLLAKYNDTIIRVFKNINNSDTGFTGYPIVYNNNLYFQYKNSLGKFQLAKYNDADTVITLIPNLNNTDMGYTGYPFIFDNKLYFQYKNTAGNFQLAKWNDTSLVLIQNIRSNHFGYSGNPIVFNNKLYFSYIDTVYHLPAKLAWLNDTTISVFNQLFYKGGGTIYNNKLLFSGNSGTLGSFCLNSLDSLGKIDTTCILIAGNLYFFLTGTLQLYKNSVYGIASLHNMNNQYSIIIKYNGTNLSKINLPPGVYIDPPYDILLLGSWQNSLYIRVPATNKNYAYRLEDSIFHEMNGSFAWFYNNGTTNTHDFTTHQNNVLFYGGVTASSNFDIGLIKAAPNNDTLIAIKNYVEKVNYNSSLLIHKNNIFFVGTATFNGSYQLMKLENIALPLTFVDYHLIYSKQESVKNYWQTANEINVSYFNIQRSLDGKNFIDIGKQSAKNKSTNEYVFFDEKLPTNNINQAIYYRIAAIDIDGKINYSETKKITIDHSVSNIKIYPNPAKDFIKIECANASEIVIIDGFGRIIKQINNVTELETINLKQFNKGIYFIKIVLKNLEIKTEKFVVQ